MYTAQLPGKGTFVIRYPRGRGLLSDWECPFEEIEVGTGRQLRDGSDLAVLTFGPIGNSAAQAIDSLKEEGCTASIAHYDMRFAKPLDTRLLEDIAHRFKRIITVEDGVRTGGIGSAVLEWMSDNGYHPAITRIGLPDEFVEHGKVTELQKITGTDTESIKNEIKKALAHSADNTKTH